MRLGSALWNPPSELAADEFRKFSMRFPEAAIAQQYNSNNNSKITLNCNDRAHELVEKICGAIESKIGFSLVRMGDGEGSCLFNDSEYPELRKYVLQRISYIHFGDDRIVPDNAITFYEMMIASILSADVVCIPELDAIKRGFHTDADKTDVRAVLGNRVSAMVAGNLVNEAQVTASAWTNRHLLGFYKRIFGGRNAVGVISSYPEISDLMKKSFGIKTVIQHTIPKQAVFVKTQDRKNSFHYPDVFMSIVDGIDPVVPGMPYLVSGGSLAKYYCHIIKSRGGVAIDTGTVPEIWLGIPNRGLTDDFISKWKLV